MLQKYPVKLKLILAFFVCISYAMEESSQFPISQNQEKPSRLHLPSQNEYMAPEDPSEDISKYFISDNHENFREQQAASSVRQNNTKFDEERMKKYIDDCPEKLKFFINIIKERIESGTNLYQKECCDKGPFVALVGPPGVGKTSLAIAIPQYCNVEYTLIKATTPEQSISTFR